MVRTAGEVAGAVAALESTAAAATLGLSRPKFVAAAAPPPPHSLGDALAGSRRRPAAWTAPPPARPVPPLSAVAGAISDGALLDLLLTGTRAKLAAAPAPGSRDAPRAACAADNAPAAALAAAAGTAGPRSLVGAAREALVRGAAAELAASQAAGPRAATRADDGWGASFDALYAHTVMGLPTLAVDGAVADTLAHDDTLHTDSVLAADTPPDVAAAQVRQATRVVRRRAAARLRVGAALVAAMQDLLADAAVVTLIREAVAADLAADGDGDGDGGGDVDGALAAGGHDVVPAPPTP